MSKHTDTPDPASPHGFVRHVAVSKVGELGLTITVTAKPGDLAPIAAYLELESLQALRAEMQLTRWRNRGIVVSGRLIADVTQTCVVTLEPIAPHIESDFERRFLPDSDGKTPREIVVDPEGEDPAEPLGREIDLGEILVEELSLALDPYPRKAGVEFAPEQDTVGKPANPFAVLTKLKAKTAKTKPKS